VPGVKGVQARGFAKGTAEFDLEVEGVTAAELAQRVHTQRGSGIAIDGYSLRRLHGQYDPAKRLRITLRIGPFENGTRQTEEEWLATAIPKLLQTQLTNTTSLDPLLTGPGQQPPTSVAEVLPYLEGGGEKETLLYLTGRYTYTGQQGELQVFVFDTGKPAQLFSLTEQGDVRKFMPVILAAARGVAEKSTSTVMQDAKLRGLACAAKLGGKPAGAQLAARKSSIEELQVALKLESKQLEGEVTLNPQTSRSLLRIWAPEVAETAVELSIEPGAAAQRVPFVLPLRSGEIAGPKPTSIELELSYRSKGEWRSEHVVRPVLLLPNEVASWMGSR